MLSQPQVPKFLICVTALLIAEQNRHTFLPVATLLPVITDYGHANHSCRLESENRSNCLGESPSVESGSKGCTQGEVVWKCVWTWHTVCSTL